MWSDKEVAFIFCFLDMCIDKDMDYKFTILNALEKFSGRKILTIVSLEAKFRKLFKEWGKASLDLQALFEEGTACLKSVPNIPESVRTEMKGMREEWRSRRSAEDTGEDTTDGDGDDDVSPTAGHPSVSYVQHAFRSILICESFTMKQSIKAMR